MPTKSKPSDAHLPRINFRVHEEVREAAERAALDDSRSLSSLVVKILSDWLRRKGYLRGKNRIAK